MPLNKCLLEWDAPVKPEVIREINAYMKSMPDADLALQCAKEIERDPSLKTVLAVTYALNGGEILLKCQPEDDDALEKDLASEFERLLGEEPKKTQPDAPLPANAS